jgi:hypothetical protein
VTVYTFRVVLRPNPPLGFEPDTDVWRDIELDGSHTLADFHEAIFEAFDRWDTHGYEFTTYNEDGMATRRYVAPHFYDGGPSWPAMEDSEIERFIEQTVPDEVSEDVEQQFRDLRADPPAEANAAETTIEAVASEQSQPLLYEFDFGDGWEHHIELRETRSGGLDDHPHVVNEHGAAPAQYPDIDE